MTDANQHGAEPTSPRWTVLPVSLWSPTRICPRPKKPNSKLREFFYNLDQHEGERIMIRQRGTVTMNLLQGGNSSQKEVPMQVQAAVSGQQEPLKINFAWRMKVTMCMRGKTVVEALRS
jgi:hypothetical protein